MAARVACVRARLYGHRGAFRHPAAAFDSDGFRRLGSSAVQQGFTKFINKMQSGNMGAYYFQRSRTIWNEYFAFEKTPISFGVVAIPIFSWIGYKVSEVKNKVGKVEQDDYLTKRIAMWEEEGGTAEDGLDDVASQLSSLNDRMDRFEELVEKRFEGVREKQDLVDQYLFKAYAVRGNIKAEKE
uniref:Uncharacterized protein n=1 Tax=Oryza punctata TaxID=4537 RepID=A0A0E0L6A8_ORYPU